jgi:endonuclease YncB( thermonuclease family)
MDERKTLRLLRALRPHRRHANWLGTLISVAIIVIIILGQLHKLPQPVINAQPGLYPVVHVDDGDTIIVSENETVKPNTPVQCGGKAASDHTKSVMTGASVRLAPDPEDSDIDKYGRQLRYVYLPDGTLYNEQLVQQGYGFAYTIFPFAKLDQFKADQAAAKAANRGIWGSCNVNASSDILQTAGPRS